MLTTERPWTATTAATISPTGYELRLHGGTEDERLIPIPPGKHSIGSGPRCSLRLQYEGVQPLECLIVRDDVGLRVRRWSEDTRLNGVPFDEASLTAGDILSLGPVELEVVVPQTEELFAEPEEPIAEGVEPAMEVRGCCDSAEQSTKWRPTCRVRADFESQVLQPIVTHSEWDDRVIAEQPAPPAATTAADEVSGERRIATSNARRRSRRVLAAAAPPAERLRRARRAGERPGATGRAGTR